MRCLCGQQHCCSPQLPPLAAGYDFVDNNESAEDCDGHGGHSYACVSPWNALPACLSHTHPHTPAAAILFPRAGTHVAASAVGLQVGVAKEASVVAVRILDCTGSGTISNTVAGLDWVAGGAGTRSTAARLV